MGFVNQLSAAWEQGSITRGAWCATPSSVSAEVVAAAGFDYVCVDMQHGAVGYTDTVPMLQAIANAGVAPIVRVAANDPSVIGRMLDAGALGVVVPLVNSGEEAARAVGACRFPPNGKRSYGPVRAGLVTGSRDVADLERVVCVVMVETLEGLDLVEEIAATPGLDGIYVGPADLALALGMPPAYERDEPDHDAAIATIKQACDRHGIIAGIHCDGGAMAARRQAQGFNMITVVNDLALIRTGAAAELIAAKG